MLKRRRVTIEMSVIEVPSFERISYGTELLIMYH
jgi:hypothetical protein